MAALLSLIDKAHNVVTALISAARTAAEAEKHREGSGGEKALANALENFRKACADFHDLGCMMEALTVELEAQGYDDPDFSFEEFFDEGRKSRKRPGYCDAAGNVYHGGAAIRALYLGLDKDRQYLAGPTGADGSGSGPHLRGFAEKLEQALKKARAFCSDAVKPVAKRKSNGPWYHEKDDARPAEYKFGPLEGMKSYLGKCLGGKAKKNDRTIEAKAASGVVWVVRYSYRGFAVWFKNERTYTAANQLHIGLQDAKSRPPTKR